MRVLLLGGTDLTLALAAKFPLQGVELAGIVYVPQTFSISYEAGQLHNARFADIAGWGAQQQVPARQYRAVDDLITHAAACGADFALAAGWYHMVPRHVRDHFNRGCAGFHSSLLPQFRGGAPLAWAILADEQKTGVTLFELGDGIDDGGVYGQREFAIGARTTVGDLVGASEAAAIDLLAACLPGIATGTLRPAPQRGQPSYALQRAPRDGRIDWTKPTAAIDRLIRAVGRPYPGAATTFNGNPVILWASTPLAGVRIYGTPGQIARIPEHPDPCVVTGDGAIVVHDATDDRGQSMLAQLNRAANQRLGE